MNPHDLHTATFLIKNFLSKINDLHECMRLQGGWHQLPISKFKLVNSLALKILA